MTNLGRRGFLSPHKSFVMKKLLLPLFFSMAVCSVYGQGTFQKLVYYDFPIVDFNAVSPTDSCYYITATFRDTIAGLRTGVMFTKLNQNGDVMLSSTIKSPDKLYSNLLKLR